MTTRHLLFMVTCLFSFSGVRTGIARAEPPKELAAFVQNAAADLSSSPLQVSPFKAAVLDTVEDLGPSDGIDQYLCWLKNDQGRVGDVAVAGRSGTYQVVAFSATGAPPNYFLQDLELSHPPARSADLTKAAPDQFVEKVPLVAADQIMLAGKEMVNLSELPCALASLFGCLQSEKRLVVDVNLAPFEAGRGDALPCLVLGTNGTAGVLLGYAKTGGGDFALPYCPRTGETRYETLADRLRKIRAAAARRTGNSPGTKDEEYQKRLERMGPERRAKIEETLARMEAENEKTIVGEEILSSLPDSLRHGVHAVDCGALRSWKTARVGKIELGHVPVHEGPQTIGEKGCPAVHGNGATMVAGQAQRIKARQS